MLRDQRRDVRLAKEQDHVGVVVDREPCPCAERESGEEYGKEKQDDDSGARRAWRSRR
jgi:hypothetical protein